MFGEQKKVQQVYRYEKVTDYQKYAAYAIKIKNLKPSVTEYDIRQAIFPLSKAALSLNDCVARIRDYSPEIVKRLEEFFPEAVVEKIPRLENKDRAFYISQVRLQKQIFSNKAPYAHKAFVVMKSTAEQSFLTDNAIKFVQEVIGLTTLEEAKIITSRKHTDAMEEKQNTFVNINNKRVNVEVIQNMSNDDMSFKIIQVKGYIPVSDLDGLVQRLCTLDVIPEFSCFEYERPQRN